MAAKRPGSTRYAPGILMVLIIFIVLTSAYFRPVPGFLWIYVGVLAIFQLTKRNIALFLSLCLSTLVFLLVLSHIPETMLARLPPSMLAVCLVCYVGAYRLEKREMAIIAQQSELEAANAAQSEFIDNVSHEMQTPLTAIKGFSELIAEDTGLNRASRSHVESVLYNTTQLTWIINDLIETTRLQGRSLRLQSKDTDLAQLLTNIVATESQIARDRGLELTISPEFPLPKYIHTDGFRLSQVLVNVIDNALKFTPQGYVNVAVKYEQRDNTIEFIVRDTGIGIAADFQDQIFERFSQAKLAGHYGNTGIGLGLYISRELTLLLGGVLSYRPVSTGSEFSLKFKLPNECEEFIHDLLPESNGAIEAEVERPQYRGHVLVAEDSITNQLLIGMMLDNYGLSHMLVADGQQAVDACMNSSYDLVLMDINMPVMNGIEAARCIKASGLDTPIVALSASALMNRNRGDQMSVFDGLLGKPIDTVKLETILASYLTNKNLAPT
ncbi:hybrid sensor histidine kinase/response regulator [Candidatus Litorirhabdus singularis]|nr:ATP-binding protein [Candidatus Litorirhabdus singularis]